MNARLILALLVALGSQAFAVEDDITDAGSAAVNACFGACGKDNNQTNLTNSPYKVDQLYKEIMDHGIIKNTPGGTGNSTAVKDGQDI